MTSKPRKRHLKKPLAEPLSAAAPPLEQAAAGDLLTQVRSTFGPLAANAGNELLTGSQLARKLLEIDGTGSETGLLHLARLLLAQDARENDGTVTTALLYQSVLEGGRAALQSGSKPSELSRALEAGQELIDVELARQAFSVGGPQDIAGLVRSAGYDDALAVELGEIFDLLGAEGRLLLRNSSGQPLERVMKEGTLWDGAMAARMMSNDGSGQRAFENPAIVISDLYLFSSEQLVQLVELAEANGIQQMLLVCSDLSLQSRSVLTMPSFQKRLWVAAVKLPLQQVDASEMLDDLALLTGGRVLRQAQVLDLANIQLEDLGWARRAWTDLDVFGIVGGQGDTLAVREHMANLRQAYQDSTEAEEKQRLAARLARMTNGSIILKLAAQSPEHVARAVEMVRAALRTGLVPGGGAALLACRAALSGLEGGSAAQAAAQILQAALEAPFRALVEAAGQDPLAALESITRCGAGYGYDVVTCQVREMRAAGICDSLAVLRSALRGAVQAAVEMLVNRSVRDNE